MKTTKKPRAVTVNVRARLYVVLMMLALGSTALVVRAVDLQIVRKDFYQGQGDARFLREIAMPVSRGMITDRNGEALAVSTPVESIWANPPELLQHPERMPELAHALGLDEQALEEKLIQRSDKEFVYLKRHLNPDDAAAILALEIPGVASQREFRRYYPSGEVLSHVVGFTNIDDRGQEGLELAFDDWLSGKPGAKRVIRDRLGHIVENVELVREPKPGHDLVLSIDRRIQYLAYRELKAAIQLNHAVSGSIVIMDVANGEVLGMVNQPSFNPNSRGNVEASYRRNRAVTDLIEPGSTIKPFTIAAALESGKWKPESMVDTTPGTLQVADHLVRDTRNYGLLNVVGVLTHSSNVGASKIAATLPSDHMYDMFHRFGFGESTGSGFPGESPGMLPAARTWGSLEKATLSYGYGLSVTPLQLAQAYVALANGGRFRPPTFVRDTQNPDSAILDPQIAQSIVGMLETVVQRGTGVKAYVPNYRIAGKTGTSRRAVTGGYESRYFSLFAGIAPASNPRLVAVIVINDPGGGLGGAFSYTGGLVSAPVFAHVMGEALRMLDVAPDNVQQWYAGVGDAPALVSPPPAITNETIFEEGVP
jgi:cell division protein FtsI (penicillin-binding protein 3)